MGEITQFLNTTLVLFSLVISCHSPDRFFNWSSGDEMHYDNELDVRCAKIMLYEFKMFMNINNYD